MPYYRRPYKRARYGKRIKYSVQQKALSFSAPPATTTTIEVVPATTIEGMRKVKHLTVNATVQGESDSFYWALVYVPQGTVPGAINFVTTTSSPGMYEPNQFVMNCGVVDGTAGPIRFSSPIGRNLNDGDSIYLVVRPYTTGGTNITINAVVRYAISLQ